MVLAVFKKRDVGDVCFGLVQGISTEGDDVRLDLASAGFYGGNFLPDNLILSKAHKTIAFAVDQVSMRRIGEKSLRIIFRPIREEA